MNLDEIQNIFFQECEEGLAAMESGFQLCRDGRHDGETINTIFRAIHSIKGGAGAFGHEALQEFAHHYETVLDRLRSEKIALTSDLLTTLLAAFDMLSDHVGAARDGSGAPDDSACLARLQGDGVEAADPTKAEEPASVDVSDDMDSLMALLESVSEPASTPDWRVDYRPDRRFLDNGGEPLLLLRELAELGAIIVATDLARMPALASFDVAEAYLGWTLRVPGTVDEDAISTVFDFVSERCEILIGRFGDGEGDLQPTADDMPVEAPDQVALPTAVPSVRPSTSAEPVSPPPAPPVAAAAKSQSPTIRIDLDKLDRLVNLVGELVITQAMLAQRLTSQGLSASSELNDLDHLTRELQDSAMSIRAQPLKTVFSRVPRIIRELEADTGKRVRLRVDGEMTEVDRTIVERIGEPLTHMIRNAVDHGVETPDERRAAGKSEEGCVSILAEHRSGRIVIAISDDGRGIDRRRVLAKAVERGIVGPDATLTDEEIDDLIFAPGFSTAEAVTSISGRGVGMDVVRKNVQALGGRIGISSTPGKGSTFTLSLPLTLAVLDGMTVQVGTEAFVIPLGYIVESLRPAPHQVTRTGPGKLVLDVRGSYLPIHSVGERLAIGEAERDPTNAVMIVVESDTGQSVLMVDTIVDQRQVVVKSLEANYAAVQGIAGATILGDGRVALILDVDGLVSRRRQDSWSNAGMKAAA